MIDPLVTVVVPMLDERGHIGACLDSFEAQTHPPDRLDVVVVDGGSADGSREYVDERAHEANWLRVVDNPARRAAAAFNVGLDGARGDVLCLFSAHGLADRDYVTASLRVLAETGAAGVGGSYRHLGDSPASTSIGLAMASRAGMASPHRFAAHRQEVDTISHPAYRTDVLRSVGGFDESLVRNSDYELNYRLRAAGHRLVFDPSIESVYRPRPSLRALGRQFWWYGKGKAQVLRRHPASLRPRHLAAPLGVLGLAAGPVVSRWAPGRALVGETVEFFWQRA